MINIKYMINKLKEINDKQRELSFYKKIKLSNC
jgi:hypothetical protein